MKIEGKIQLILLVTLIVISVLMGCEPSQEVTPDLDEGLLTEQAIADLLNDELEIEKSSGDSPVEINNGIVPGVYDLSNSIDRVFIYVFESIEDRYEVFPADFSSYSSHEDIGLEYVVFNAKNAAIVFKPGDNRRPPAEITNLIGKLAYYQLNDIAEVTYKGRGNDWEVKLDASYFDYELEGMPEDRTNYGRFDYDYNYLGENHESINELAFFYLYEDGMGKRGTGRKGESFLEETPSLMNFSGSTFPDGIGSEETKVLLEWVEDDVKKEETIVLRKQ